MLSDDCRQLPCCCFDATHCSRCENFGAIADCRTRDCRRCFVRLRPAIGRRVHRALPFCFAAGHVLRKFIGVDHARADSELIRSIDPCCIPVHLPVGRRRVQNALLAIPDILADLVFEPAPDTHALDDHRHFTSVASLLPNPAPVPTRLLTRDMAFLTNDDLNALFGEKPGGRHADDSAADDNDVCRRRN